MIEAFDLAVHRVRNLEHHTMTPETANKIYDVLLAECGPFPGYADRHTFVWSICDRSDEATQEYRFQGNLGFGGKFWATNSQFYVTCYAEDRTPERNEIIERVNKRLSTIFTEQP